MKTTGFLLILLLLAGSVNAYPEYGQPSQAVSLHVRVINVTAQGRPVSGDEVMVERYNEDTLIDRIQGLVNDEGWAVFENVYVENLTNLQPSARHDNVRFWGDRVAVPPGQNSLTSVVHLYDVTDDMSQLSTSPYHIIIKQGPQGLVVQEYLELINASDKAIHSSLTDSEGRNKTLIISLPNGYKHFSTTSYLVPGALIFTEEEFYDPMAIPPGSHKVIFGYTLDIKSDPMAFSKKITLPTSSATVFIALENVTVEGLGPLQGELTLTDGVKSQYYTVGDLSADETISFQIRGLKVSDSGLSTWVLLGIVFGIILVVVIWRLRSPSTNVENN